MKVHSPSQWGNDIRGLCGAGSRSAVATTDDPSEVTCLSCQARIEEDLEPMEAKAEREGRSKAKQRARSRAVSVLVERHLDEFEQLWSEFEVELREEAIAEARRITEERARWDAEWKARRRAELEEQLARL